MPLACMNQEVGNQIGGSVGKVLEVVADNRGLGWGKFLRMRVEIDIRKALMRNFFYH